MAIFSRKVFRSALTVTLLVAAWSGQALAESDQERAGARKAAEAGAQAFEEGRFADALELMSKAESLVHATPHLLYIARSHAALGHLVAAQEAYMRIVNAPLPANAAPVLVETRDAAAKELETLEPRIPQLTIQITGASTSDVTVTIDGKPVPNALLGIGTPVDPGTHEIEASGASVSSARTSVTLTEGGKEEVSLAVTPTGEASEAQPSGAAVSTDSAVSEGSTSLRTTGLIVGGVGVAALIGGGVTAFLGFSKKSDLDDRCPGGECPYADATEKSDIDSDKDSLKTLGLMTTVLLAGGGVLTATGATLYIVGGPDTEERVSLAPTFAPGVAGLYAQGAF